MSLMIAEKRILEFRKRIFYHTININQPIFDLLKLADVRKVMSNCLIACVYVLPLYKVNVYVFIHCPLLSVTVLNSVMAM